MNLFLGYDIDGFLNRMSAFLLGRSLSGLVCIATGDRYLDDYLSYDMSLRYRVNDNLFFLLTGVNLTSTPYVTSLRGRRRHSSYSVYGAKYDFGGSIFFKYNYGDIK